jgi:uncharacterized integral membrane protein
VYTPLHSSRHLVMKIRTNAYSVVGVILLLICGILAVANIRPIHDDQCSWQFPRILSCLSSARETLAAGLIGTGGAIFAAWLAWTAVLEQIASDERQLASRSHSLRPHTPAWSNDVPNCSVASCRRQSVWGTLRARSGVGSSCEQPAQCRV